MTSEAYPPTRNPLLPCCSVPASAQPKQLWEGFPESFLSCALYSGDSPNSQPPVQVEGSKGGPVPSPGLGAQISPLQRIITLGLQLPFFLWGQSRPQSALSIWSWPDQTFCLLKFPSPAKR